MNADEYQNLAGRTCLNKPNFKISDREVMISWNALGLAGEAGEVVELVKKGIYHQQGFDDETIKKELGDVLWYVAALCRDFGFRMSDVMDGNIKKLESRYPDGFHPKSTNSKAD